MIQSAEKRPLHVNRAEIKTAGNKQLWADSHWRQWRLQTVEATDVAQFPAHAVQNVQGTTHEEQFIQVRTGAAGQPCQREKANGKCQGQTNVRLH